MNGWRLERRLLLGSVIVLSLMGVAAGVVGVSYASLVSSQEEVTDTYFGAIADVGELNAAVLEQDTSVRTFVVADGDPAALVPYEEAVRREADAAARLREQLADDPTAAALLDTAARAAKAWRSGYADRAIEQVRTQGPGAVGRPEARAGVRLLAEARRAVADLDVHVRRGRQAAIDDLSTARDRMAVVFVLGLVLLLVATGVVAYLLRRWVLRPLSRLGAESLTVASGQVEHEVRVDGPPEFVALAQDVDMMRRRIVAQLDEASAARASLEDQRRVLAEQTHELRRSNEELEQFAYVASHDLQEPLRKVASFTQLLEERYGEQLDERARQYIAFAADGARRMQQLVNDLLTFSRVTRDDDVLGPVDLGAALDTALTSLDDTVRASGAVVTRDPLPTVRGQEGLLVQLLQNLVGNSLKFARPGTAPRVHVSARRDGAWWEVSVSDDGIGVDPQFAERVFVIFQRLNRRDEYGGTGIGLALCRKIVEHHGGRIWLGTARSDGDDDGAPGSPDALSGATFRFTLPADDGGRPPRTP